MKRRVLAILIIAIILINSSYLHVFAESTKSLSQSENNESIATIGEIGGYLKANIDTVKNLDAERKFTYENGHGFAAERGNNLADVFSGKKAIVVGDDNAKNGADRKIINRDGTVTLIQDKYYSTATKSVNAAFDEESGMYRYIDGDGNPMKLEVPADQYEDAVSKMAKKIEEGKVPGVTDSSEASKLVQQGHLTYQQAVNLTKAGTIDSLKYDAANGIIVAKGAMGISFVLDFAMCLLNGQDMKEALENACLNGIKTGGVAFATYVISSQLAKTGLVAAMAPTTDAIAKSLGKGLSETLLKISGVETAELTGAQITTKVAKLLTSQIITAGVLVVVLSADDVVNLFQGRISKEQLLQNLVVTVASVGGTYIGSLAGGAAGTLIVPGIGTTVGSIAGGVLGGTAAAFVAQNGMAVFFESDSDKMYEIISAKFESLCNDYLITEEEANELVDELKDKLSGDVLKDMYQSDDREQFAENLMEPLFTAKAQSREKINIPTEEETRAELVSMLDGIVFIH